MSDKELKVNYDNGSQEFFDDLTKRRIRKMGFDRGVILPSSQYIAKLRQMEVKEEGAKRAIEYYKKSGHISPVKNTVEVDYEHFARHIDINMQQSRRQNQAAFSVDEQINYVPAHIRNKANAVVENLRNGVSPFPQYSLLKETMGQGYGQPQQIQHAMNGAGNVGQSFNVCRIMQGCAVFKTIETQGFGSTSVLARSIGQADPRTASYQYNFKQIVEAYIVPPNQKVVDLALLENNPQLKSKLAVLEAPQMAMVNATTPLGLILVPLDAIIKEMQPGQQYSNNGRNILVDSRYGVPTNRPQQNIVRPTNIPAGKTILRG